MRKDINEIKINTYVQKAKRNFNKKSYEGAIFNKICKI